jgi:hypothetical protein
LKLIEIEKILNYDFLKNTDSMQIAKRKKLKNRINKLQNCRLEKNHELNILE